MLTILGLPGLSAAQESIPEAGISGVTVTDSGNRIIYGPEYFSQYNVITASDQLDHIPGIQDIVRDIRRGGGGDDSGDDQRGFGSSGGVLVNGRRVSGKSNDVGSVLDRIQARQVVRIEVIRGPVAGLDVRSQGRLVNVVLDDTLTTSYGAWQISLDRYSDGRYGGGGELGYNGDFGPLNYLFSLQTDLGKESNKSSDLFFTLGNELFERQSEASLEETRDYSFSTNTSYTFGNGDILNLNGLYSRQQDTEGQTSRRFSIAQRPQRRATFVRGVLIADDDTSRNWELGGDYEHVLPGGSALHAVFIYSSLSGDEQSAVSFTPAGGVTALEDVQLEDSQSTEKILRSTYEWSIGDHHSFESGAELAINTVDEDTRLFENNNGMLEETPLFNQESLIEETRYDGFTNYTWQASPSLLLASSIDLEYSELRQQGNDVNRTRNFFFARPRLVVRYDLNPLSQLRARIERTVSQLDFDSFVASFNNDDNRFDIINAGNPELVPEKSWEYEVTYERRLTDNMGVVAIRAQYSDVQDKIGRIPLLIRTEDGETVERTAPGNIGDGSSMELEVSGSLRLDRLGPSGAVINASIEFQESDVTDPFTGEQREFKRSPPYRWSLEFRHDTSWHNVSYGMETRNRGPEREYDLDYWQVMEDDVDLEFFAEIQPIEDLTLRLSVEHTLRAEDLRERFLYAGNRESNVLERRELRRSKPSREITFSVHGTF